MASALSGMVNQTSAYAAGGVVPFRMGNSHPSLFPYEPLPTADGDLIITAGNDAQFRKLCEVLGAPELADDPRFASNDGRTANRDELRPLLAERLATRTAAEWFRDLIAAGVPCGPINTVDGGIAFARDIGLEPVVTAGEGEAAVPTIRHPISFSATPPRYPLPPPALDEHGDADPRLARRAARPARVPRPGPPARARRERAHDRSLGTCPASPPRWAPPTRTPSPCSARTSPPT